ncbi:MAG: hypothetical protein V4585_18580 [Bacteroidota bacterium]
MKNNNLKNILWGFLIFLPIATYFYFLSEYAINIPKWDDHALKAFILDFFNADNIIVKIQTLFKQHNEHRIAFDRFFTLAVFWIHGSIEYRWLMWIGNFSLIGVLLIFYKIFQKQKLSLAFFVPIPLILFQLQLWENTFWGMAALQNFGIVFFILGLIYFISSDKKNYFYLALFFAFCATYTSGNGITAFPICIVLLVLQRRFRDAIIFGVISATLSFLYFYHYQMPPSNPPMVGIGIGKIILGFFSFLGSVFDLIPSSSGRIKLTIIFGIVIFIASAIIAIYLIFSSSLLNKRSKLNQSQLFILGSFMFLIGTGIVVTYTRISFGEIGLLTSRYKIYSILLLITLYLVVISKLDLNNLKWAAFPIILIPICFNCVANYINFKEVDNFRNQLISFGINWELEPKQVINTSIIKLHEAPKLINENSVAALENPVLTAPVWGEKIVKTVNANGYFIQNTTLKLPKSKDIGIFMVAQSSKRTYIIPSQLMNYPLKTFVKTGNYWQNGFVAELNNNEFENGNYQLGIWIREGLNGKIYSLEDSIIVQNIKPRNVKTNW